LAFGTPRPLLWRFMVFLDADFAGCRLDRKSTSGTCQFLGSSLVPWSSRKQSSVAQSTTDVEYLAAASCFSQLLWISYTKSDFGEEYTHVPLQCDNTSAISVAKNPVLHSKTRHIEVRQVVQGTTQCALGAMYSTLQSDGTITILPGLRLRSNPPY
jgi:hypothetical protein